MKTKVINLVGGPGAGKSTIAAGVFSLLKMSGREVELVQEYPKSLVWEERQATFDDSLYLFAKQAHFQYHINNKVDYMITDRPLIMSNIYHNFWMAKSWPNEWNETFYKMVKETWNLYDNRVYFINRVMPYDKHGRNETEYEARQQDVMFKKCLDDYEIDYEIIDGNSEAHFKIFDDIVKKEQGQNIPIL